MILIADEKEEGHSWSLGCISHNKLDAVELPPLRHPFVKDLLEDIFGYGTRLYHLVDQHQLCPRGIARNALSRSCRGNVIAL
jgi:hypothetical protein